MSEEYPQIIHISFGGPFRKIEVDGRMYQFEMHHYCGPMPCNKDETDRKSDWPQKVWDAVQAWCDQGQEISDDGMCVLETTKESEV